MKTDILASDIFISYANADEKEAEAVKAELEAEELSCYLAPHYIDPGDPFKEEIDTALTHCKELVVLLSRASMSSQWVFYEVGMAKGLDKPINLVLLDVDFEKLPSVLNHIHSVKRHQINKVVIAFRRREPHSVRSEVTIPAKADSDAQPHWQTQCRSHFEHIAGQLQAYAGTLRERISYDAKPPAIFYPNPTYNKDVHILPERFSNRVLVDTIHAGDVIPNVYLRALLKQKPGENFLSEIGHFYRLEKDWGANYVALALSQFLNLKGFLRVNIARALMDFGRFPGITNERADHLSRHAINYPFSVHLDYETKRQLLEQCYDKISKEFEDHIEGKVLKVAIHTFDRFNPPVGHERHGTVRPDVSLSYSSDAYNNQKRMPLGVFDSLFPDELAEYTADRRLAAHISLELERAGISVAHNHPYHLPDGSVELRAQVWFFFMHLRKRFEDAYPTSKDDEVYNSVWRMLLDTNLRRADSELLRSYIHMFRKRPVGEIEFQMDASGTSQDEHGEKVILRIDLEGAKDAYEEIRLFFNHHGDELLREYTFSSDRPSSLVVEIRKDLVWEYQRDGLNPETVDLPTSLRVDNVAKMASLIATAILTYLFEDRL